jgi:hypothetical protein
MSAKNRAPMTPPPSPSDDLVPRSMLPPKSVIPPGREFGAGAPKYKPKKKMAGGGMAHSSASRRADGIAQRGKTKGRFV